MFSTALDIKLCCNRERKREREREREREGERERERETDRQTDRQTETKTDSKRHTERVVCCALSSLLCVCGQLSRPGKKIARQIFTEKNNTLSGIVRNRI